MNLPLIALIDLASVQSDQNVFDFTVVVPGTVLQPFISRVPVKDDEISPVEDTDLGFLNQMPVLVRQRFLTLLFRFCFSEMNEADGAAIERSFADVTKLLQIGMPPEDAQVVFDYLIGVTAPGAMAVSRSIVRID